MSNKHPSTGSQQPSQSPADQGSSSPIFDVLIIGGGLAGSSMAAALASLPISIAMVEAATHPLQQSPSFDDRALALSYGSLQILETIGVLAGIAPSEQTPIDSIHVSDRGHLGMLRLHKQEVDTDYLGAVITARDLGGAMAALLDAQVMTSPVASSAVSSVTSSATTGQDQTAADLPEHANRQSHAKSLAKQAAISLFTASTVTDIVHKPDHAQISIEPVPENAGTRVNSSTADASTADASTADASTSAQDQPPLKQKVRAKLVVLADGGRSSLTQQLGINTQRSAYDQTGVLANIRADREHQNIAYERFTADGPIALLPLRERDYKLVWTVPPAATDDIMALSDDAFMQAVQTAFGDRAGEFVQVGKRVSYPMVESAAQQITLGRVALIGNSAHTLHPIAGQGFNLGLRDVACLAELIANAWQEHTDIGAPTLLRHYAEQRQQDIAKTAMFTDGLVRVFSNRNLPLAALRNLALLGIDRVPAAKREIMHKMMGLSGTPSKLMRGQALYQPSKYQPTSVAMNSAALTRLTPRQNQQRHDSRHQIK